MDAREKMDAEAPTNAPRCAGDHDPAHCCDKVGCESRTIVQNRIAAEKKYLENIGLPRFIGKVFPKTGFTRLLWETTETIPNGEFSFEQLHLDYKDHSERAADSALREEAHGERAQSSVPTRLPILNDQEKNFDITKVSPDEPGNPGRHYVERYLTEFVGGRPCGPLHCAYMAMLWLKFNRYKFGDLVVGGCSVRDLFSMIKIGLVVNGWNINVNNLDGDAQKRPTESELRAELKRLYQRVSLRRESVSTSYFPIFCLVT